MNYSSIDSYNLKLQGIMSRFILEKNHTLTDIVTKFFVNVKLQRDMNIFQCQLVWTTIIIVTKFTVERLHELY